MTSYRRITHSLVQTLMDQNELMTRLETSPSFLNLVRAVRKLILLATVCLFVAVTSMVSMKDANAQQSASAKRLDRNLSDIEACEISLTGGPKLRIPRELLSPGSCKNAEKQVAVKELRFSISFPDMTSTNTPTIADQIFERAQGAYVQKRDRFKVRIVWLFYPIQIKDATYRDWGGAEPQVWQIIEGSRLNPGSYPSPLLENSPIKGLKEIHFGAPTQLTPEILKLYKDKGLKPDLIEKAYIQDPGKNYSLLMSCDGQFMCTAHVQIATNLIQYRMEFPNEAVQHTSEVIEEINHMVGNWFFK